MTNAFIPSSDVRTLSARCSASLSANGELLGALLQDLPKDKLDDIDRLLAGGGSVGIETLVDAKAQNKILVVGIEREGNRRIFAEVSTAKIAGTH